jgi:apolipoprotein N-acyltransferase
MLNAALSLATAALVVVSFPSLDQSWLAAVALVPLLVAAARERFALRRFLLGYAAGVVYWFATCYWIQFVLEFHGGMGKFGSWGSFALFCLAKAAHLGLFAMLAGVVIGRWYAIPAVAAIWVAIERTHGPLGFAWHALGNAGIDMSVPLRVAPFTGVYGLSFIFVMMSAALALVILRRSRRELAWLLALPLLYLLPPLPEARRGSEAVVLLQPNISQTEEFTRESFDAMVERLSYTSLRAALGVGDPATLIIWPEVPAPFHFDRDHRFRAGIIDLARLSRSFVLAGVVAHTPAGEPLNSAVLLDPAGNYVDRYDKMFLVPFGEFVPPLFGFVNRITHEAGDFAPGKRLVVFPVRRRGVGTFICYEAVFPHLVRRFADAGAQVLVNISNDGYFGRTAARQQHLKIVRMRAVENRRWILRSTNDGITAVIDPAGRVLERLPPFEPAALRTGFSYESKQTVYTRHGDWFVWLCAIIGAAALVACQFPRYRPG